MNFLLLFTLLIGLTASCSVSEDSEDVSQTIKSHENLNIQPNEDYDGDGRTNFQEKLEGTDIYKAELPIIDIKFAYKMRFRSEFLNKNTNEEIDLEYHYNNNHFESKYNNNITRNVAIKAASKNIRLGDTSVVNSKENEFEFIKSPSIKTERRISDLNNLHEILSSETYEYLSTNLVINSKVHLSPDSHFNQISSLKLGIYILNKELNKYEMVASSIIHDTLIRGEEKEFSIEVSNLSRVFLLENHLKRNDGFYIKVEDYKIDSANISYSTLKKQIKAKTIPVYITTPDKTSREFVSLHYYNKLSDIVKRIFKSNYEIESNEIKRIANLSTTLTPTDYLNELRGKHKEGKWFILTNRPHDNIYNLSFTNNDFLTFAYLTGDELSRAEESNTFFYKKQIRSKEIEENIQVGKFNKNTEISLTFSNLNFFGERHSQETIHFDQDSGSCGKNCTRFEERCSWRINKTEKFKKTLNENIDKFLNDFKLIVNDKPYSFADLINNDSFRIRRSVNAITFVFYNKDILDQESNNIKVSVPTVKENIPIGTELIRSILVGKNILANACFVQTLGIADKETSYQINSNSLHIDEIFNKMRSEHRSIFKKTSTKQIFKKYEFNLMLISKNYYN